MPAEREDFPIARVAALARLQLSPTDAALYQAQLARILGFVDRVAAPALDGPAACGGDHRTPVIERPDTEAPSLDAEAALENAPDAPGVLRLIRVPKVIG
jgi:aspartyl/glutamyl-tRNA(Asn/Gln) amidotransferase C subunit